MSHARRLLQRSSARADSFLIGADTQLVTHENYEQRTLDIIVHCVSFNVLEHDLFKKFANFRNSAFGIPKIPYELVLAEYVKN